MVTHAPTRHWGVFLFIVVVTGGLYFNFAWFREQLCIILCPYGRLQSALIDDNSVVIGYDARRGEPRGHVKSSGAKSGDCIDCLRCVQVCPTGIDIRQGLQMECIACSACVDACDEVMDRVGRPRGLVRYDSLNGLSGLSTRIIRPRIVLYSLLLLAGTVAASFSVSQFQGATFEAVRMQGAPYYLDDDSVRNQFLIRVINKQAVEVEFTLRVQALAGDAPPFSVAGWDEPLRVPAGAEEVRPLIITVPRESYAGKFPFAIVVTGDPGAVLMDRRTDFVGPDPKLLKEHGAAHR
jgi:cytochrome c oxidase accessory protein FixG